jgi:hypothetical protein
LERVSERAIARHNLSGYGLKKNFYGPPMGCAILRLTSTFCLIFKGSDSPVATPTTAFEIRQGIKNPDPTQGRDVEGTRTMRLSASQWRKYPIA